MLFHHVLWTKCLCPPRFLFEALTLSVMVLEGGALERQCGSDAIMGVGPPDEISALLRGDTREFTSSVLKCPKERTCGTQPEGDPLLARKRALARFQIGGHFDLGLLSLQTMRKKCLLF